MASDNRRNTKNTWFTLPNVPMYDFQWLPEVQYAIWQVEKEKDGDAYILGYIEFKKPVSLKKLKKL